MAEPNLRTRRMEPNDKDQSVQRRYSFYLASPEVIDIARKHSVPQQQCVDLHRFIHLIHREAKK